jgi:glycosyltransferase involved in cell wall biosynthesis
MSVARHGTHLLLLAREPATFADEGFWAAWIAALVEEEAVVSLWTETAALALARRLEHAGAHIGRLRWPADRPLMRFFQAWALGRRFAASATGLVHLFGVEGAAAVRAAARRAGAATVVTIDRLPPAAATQVRRADARLGRLLAGFDAVEVPSPSAAERLRTAVPALAGRIHIVPPALDAASRSPERVGGRRVAALLERWQLDPARRLVLLPGPIQRGRGHLLALRAMAACTRDDFDLLFLGDERADPAFVRELQSVLRATGLVERVRFAASVEDRPAVFALADLALYLPVPDELVPLPLLEAQAAGVPVVTLAGLGFEDFLLPAVTGWLVAAGDRDALAAAMTAALSLDAAARERLAARCRDFVTGHHQPERAIAARLRLYGTVLNAPPARSTAREITASRSSAREEQR